MDNAMIWMKQRNKWLFFISIYYGEKDLNMYYFNFYKAFRQCIH